MRVVFMGTPEFAVPALEALIEHHEVVAVYTRPDAASKRGNTLHPCAVKCAALEHGVEVRSPQSLRDPSEVAALQELAPDVIVVCAYGMILPRPVLDAARWGCVNIHASLLPRWRGAAPIQRAILAGDTQTGVCIMRMEEGLDTGPYCACATVPIDERDTESLSAELASKGALLLMDALPAIANDSAIWTKQDDVLVTYADKLDKRELLLDPSLDVGQALRRIRASSATTPARASVAGKGLAVTRASRSDETVRAGGVRVTKAGLVLGFADGALLIATVKPEGKREMPAADWARGLRVDDASTWAGVS